MDINPVKFNLIDELMKDTNKVSRLFGYAISLFNSYPNIERYFQPCDLISSAYTKLLDESRSWDPSLQQDALIKVIEIMKSEFWNFLSKHKENLLSDDEFPEIYNDQTSESYEYTYELDGNRNLCVYKNEYDYEIHKLINKCRNELSFACKTIELEVFDLCLLGYKNQRIAKELDISVTEVSNAKRRIIDYFKDKSGLKNDWINL